MCNEKENIFNNDYVCSEFNWTLGAFKYLQKKLSALDDVLTFAPYQIRMAQANKIKRKARSSSDMDLAAVELIEMTVPKPNASILPNPLTYIGNFEAW